MELFNINLNSDWLKEFIKQSFGVFKRLTEKTQLTILTVVILTGFWFVPIYFNAHEFYLEHPLIISLLLAFLGAVTWLIVNILLFAFGVSVLSESVDPQKYDLPEPPSYNDFIVFGGLNSIVYLSVIIFIAYLADLPFKWFLVLCCGYPAFAVFSILMGNRKNNKSPKVEG